MTRLYIPAVRDGSGQTLPATASIHLERAPQNPLETWRPAIGFVGAELATEYASLPIPADGLFVDLSPNSTISMPDASATAYAVRIHTRNRTELYRVQVPNSIAVLSLSDLVGPQSAELGPPLWESLLAQTADDRLATAADAANTGLDRVAAQQASAATAADRAQTGQDRAATGADAQATAADRVQTGLDAAATAADRVQTGLDRVQTGLDRMQTGQDTVATAADRVQTWQDRAATAADAQATAADRVQTGLDADATAADRVQTGLDRAATGADAQATAADRVQTAADRAIVAANATALFLVADGPLGATFGVGDALVVGSGTEPYDHITLALEIP